MRSIFFSRGPCCRRGAIELPLPAPGRAISRLLIPNTCQVPNVLLDEVMPRIGGVALKVLCC